VQIGKLDSYIRFEQKQVAIDPNYGSEVITWAEYRTAWARLDDVTTRQQESTESNLRLLKRPCRVTVRYDEGIDVTMRIVILDRGDRVMQIVSKPAEIGRREGLEFMAEDYEV
jgi:SPP1 family predicted phage head-tail adaptor